MLDIVNKGLFNGVFSKHLRPFDWLRGLYGYRNCIVTPRHSATKYGNNLYFRNNIYAGNKAYMAEK